MKLKTLFAVLLALSLGACKSAGPAVTPSPAAPTTAPTTLAPTPPTPASVQIGPEGGTVTSTDGRVQVLFPAGAMPAEHTITVTTREKRPEDGAALSPIIEITLSPAPQIPLEIPAALSLREPFAAPQLQFARQMQASGSALSGETLPPLTYWLPLAQTRLDAQGYPVLRLAQFSIYAPITQTTAATPACAPTTADLTPPPTPSGYVYLGAEVMINSIYSAAYSTAPLTRLGNPQDLLHVITATGAQSGLADCDLVVVHRFTPEISDAPTVAPCQPDSAALAPPAAPAGYVYVGAEVVINRVWDESFSTAPLDRPEGVNDLRIIAASGITQQFVSECDIVVSHIFEPAPSGGTPTDCAPPEQILEPPSLPGEGYVYVGRAVTINQVYDLELSTVPLGRAPVASDQVLTASSTKTRDGVLLCDTVVNHIFAREDAPGATVDCEPTAAELALPQTPEGYVYVGRDIVINGVLDSERSTVPLERPESPQDINIIRAHSEVQNGVTRCDVIVRHLFAPLRYTGCAAPEALLIMPTPPPCHRYVGVDVVINHQLVHSTTPLERPFQPTDVVQISSSTTVVDGQLLCDIIVAHTFEPIPCPACQIVVQTAIAPFVSEKPNGVHVTFPPCCQLSGPDWAALQQLSITEPISSTHGANITLPPGAQVSTAEGTTTITLPPGQCQ